MLYNIEIAQIFWTLIKQRLFYKACLIPFRASCGFMIINGIYKSLKQGLLVFIGDNFPEMEKRTNFNTMIELLVLMGRVKLIKSILYFQLNITELLFFRCIFAKPNKTMFEIL
jgi:hypothetical protein